MSDPGGEQAAVAPGSALRAVRDRYAGWLDLSAEDVRRDRAEPADQIRAIQLILRLEKDREPSWHAALALAARGCAALCLDPRSDPGGPWFEAVHDYCAGHIRKVTRRGRGAPWLATADLPGLTLMAGQTEVRVLVPGLVSELDRRVATLQVGGTDLPVDQPQPDGTGLELMVPVGLPLTAGKLMAQTGHAGMLAAALLADRAATLTGWAQAGCPSWVRRCDPAEWAGLLASVADPRTAWQQEGLVAVRDAGFTEVAPGTMTVIARWAGPR